MKKTLAAFLIFCVISALVIAIKPARYTAAQALDSAFAAVSDKRELMELNADLAARCDELESKIAGERKLFYENSELKRLMGIKIPGDKVTARVLNGSLKTEIFPFVVSKGASDGIKAGQCAVFSGGLAGIVTDCGDSWAEITPVSAGDFAVSVTDCANGQVYLLKKNRLMYVSAEDAAVGDILATSGMNDCVPGGIKVGKITKIEKKNGGNAIVTVEPYVNVKELEYVIIPL